MPLGIIITYYTRLIYKRSKWEDSLFLVMPDFGSLSIESMPDSL